MGNFSILAYFLAFQVLIVDNFGILALFQVFISHFHALIADKFCEKNYKACSGLFNPWPPASLLPLFYHLHHQFTDNFVYTRRHNTWDRRRKTDMWQEMWDRRHETGYVRKDTGDRRHVTGDMKQETGDMKQATWDKRCETGDLRQKNLDRRQEALDKRRES